MNALPLVLGLLVLSVAGERLGLGASSRALGVDSWRALAREI